MTQAWTQPYLTEQVLNAVPLLLQGDPGTGKSTLGPAIHAASPLRRGPLVVFDAKSEQITPSRFRSLLQSAEKGTFFIDNTERLAPGLQAEVVHAQKEALPPWRLMASSQYSLADLQRRGRVIEEYAELFRDRVLKLARVPKDGVYFRDTLRRLAGEIGLSVPELSESALEYLQVYEWPGNFRELELILRDLLYRNDGEVVQLNDLPIFLLRAVNEALNPVETNRTLFA